MSFLMVHLRNLDWYLIITVLLLVSVGLVSIYSSSLGRGDFLNFKKQVIFAIVGFFLMFLISLGDYRILRNDPHLILILYILCFLSLVGLFFFAPTIRGVKSWYKLGPISIDPTEFTKIILIILLAKYFSMRHIEVYRIRHIILSGIYVLLPSILIFFQPDFGSVLIFIALWISILLISGIKLRHFFVLCVCGLLIFILSWQFLLKDYQKGRILSFIAQNQADPLGTGWSQTQSQIAIGAGGLLGQGIGRGSQTQYGFLPEPHTDFIFAAIAEETGLAGVGFLLFLFSFLLWRIVKMGISVQTNFPRLFAIGLATLLISQIFIHIGMNLGILPIIGIPLPLVSYGGSGLIAIFIAIGILENIKVSTS